uniref:Tyrosinase copper-binding domain-containing protein n=1 Tax=Acrobeloides nanus TaxID=290746 RepID=A0A914BV37_9BILA
MKYCFYTLKKDCSGFTRHCSVFGQDPCSYASSPAFKILCQQFQVHNNRAQHNEQPIMPTTTAAPIPEWCKNGECGGSGGPGSEGTPPSENLIGVNLQDFMDPSYIVECQDVSCLCDFLGTSDDLNRCTLPNGNLLKKAIRKEYRTLSDDERTRFHNAINKLKSSKVYDHFHALHYHYSYGSGAHGGPAFALWHREFIKRLEFALREIDPTIALPYWDVTMDQILPDPKDSIMWTADFMGSVDSNGNVNSGPFASWTTLEVIDKREYSDRQIFEQTVPLKKLGKKRIVRKVGSFGNILFADVNITRILTNNSIYLIFGDGTLIQNCSSLNWLESIDGTLWVEKTLEGIHGMVHLFVGGIGGDMGEFQTAVGDPVFFLLHGFVDFIFEMWRQTQQYTDLFYEYDPRPRCDVKNCGSKYLFCDNSKNQKHCGVKIKVGDNPCYNGWCRNIDDGKPCVRCRRGSCVAGQRSTGQTSPRQRNPPFLNQTRNNNVYTSSPPYRTTPRPYMIPGRVTNVPSINVNNRQKNVSIPNVTLITGAMMQIYVVHTGPNKDVARIILRGCHVTASSVVAIVMRVVMTAKRNALDGLAMDIV